MVKRASKIPENPKTSTHTLKKDEVLVPKDRELVEQNHFSLEANGLQSDFLAKMTHELRSPLTGIIGFAELMHLEKVGPVSPEHKEYLGDILNSSRHLLQLINDILDLVKLESHNMEFHPKKISVNLIIAEVCETLRTLISKRKIRITTTIDPSVANIVIDPAKLKQILYNYISNALNFTPEEGTVKINVIPEGTEYFRLEVEDTGIGIRNEDIPHLFTEFQQLVSTVNKNYQGTGLGLALAKRIAQAQGGQVGVKSILNEGSTFFIILPRLPIQLDKKTLPVDAVANEISQTVPSLISINSNSNLANQQSTISINNSIQDSASMKSSAKILLIEEDSNNKSLLSSMLIDEGYAVEVVFSGAQAIRIGQENPFDAITLDLLLADMNGWDVLRALRSKGPNLETPTIVLTNDGSKAASFGFMVQNFLIKPIKSDDLIAALEQTGVFQNQNKTILFVDDDPHMLMICRHYMKNYGATILCETDPEHALIIAQKNRPDVIVLDLLMPGIDGLEFLMLLRKKRFGIKIPVIICTSQDINDVDKTRIKASVAAVVQKGEISKSNFNVMSEIKSLCPLRQRGK